MSERKSLAEKVDCATPADRLLEVTLPLPADHRRGGLDEARALLEHSGANVWVAAACGDLDAARRWLEEDRSLARADGGTRNWDPLLYLCFSQFLRTERAESMRAIARLLLEAGADPNTSWIDPNEAEGNRETPLYGAAGVANDVALARLLIEAGADPNDGETAYHMVEHPGVPTADAIVPKLEPFHRGIALAHQIDYDDEAGLERLLELGCRPTDPSPFSNRPLHQAVFRGRGKQSFDLLIAHGAPIDEPNGDGRTAYALAARCGRRDIMGWLEQAGASTELAPTDAFIAACAAGDVERARAIELELDGELGEHDRAEICEAADAGNTDGVRAMLELGWDVDTPGRVWKETAAHRAAMNGHVETLALLIERGADLTRLDRSYRATPLGWAQHGKREEAIALLNGFPERLDLWDAIELGHDGRALELIGALEDVQAPQRDGGRGVLLRLAAFHGRRRIAEELLRRGGDPTLAPERGPNAIEIARRRGDAELATLLDRKNL